MRFVTVTLLVLSALLAKGQDLSGIWRGSFSSADNVMEMLNISDRYKLEVQIDQQNKAFTGVTYSYKTTVFYGKASASGTINPANGKIKLIELAMLELKMQQNSFACIMTYTLQYSKNEDEEFLEGTYTSFNEKDSSPCGKGTVSLRRVHTSDFYIEPFLVKKEKEKARNKALAIQTPKKISPPLAKNNTAGEKVPKPDAVTLPKPQVGKTPLKNTSAKIPPKGKPLAANTPPSSKTVVPQVIPDKPTLSIARVDTTKNELPALKKAVVVPKVIASRENELVKTITVNSNQVSINIYDNGTIDHDTVSVYLDNKLVISKQMLTTSPLTLKFELDEANAVHELVMVAENLGDIPPNTSLMVVRAGDKQYEVRITSTEQKNAVVIFKYEKAKQ